MAQIILDQPQIVAAIGEREAAGMAQHVGIDMAETGMIAGGRYDIVDSLPGQRLLPLRDEEPGQPVLALSKPTPDRAQLIAFDGMFDAEPAFQPRHPEAGLRQIDIITAERDGLRHPEPVAEQHQDEQVIASIVPANLGGCKKPVDLREAKIFPPALMRIGGPFGITLDISPCGHGLCGSTKVKETRGWPGQSRSTLYKMRIL